jgi:hypothetical protein
MCTDRNSRHTAMVVTLRISGMSDPKVATMFSSSRCRSNTPSHQYTLSWYTEHMLATTRA